MKYRWDKKYLYWGITGFLVIVSSILFFQMLNRFDVVAQGLRLVGGILTPFVVGFVLAYLLNPILEFFEHKCFEPLFAKRKNAKPGNRAPRVLGIVVTFLLTTAVVTGLIFMVIPQLYQNIMGMVNSLPGYIDGLRVWLIDLFDNNKDLADLVNDQFASIKTALTGWVTNSLLPQMNDILSTVTSGVMGLVGVFMDTFVGIVVAVYVLFSKEKFAGQAKKMCYSLFSVKASNVILRTTRRADVVFGGFIKGKLIDSAIIGVLCFLGMTLFQMPYAPLISVIIGVFNIIPFFGPIIGAVPSALLILMSDITHPLTCVYFVLFIVVLQQFDGNILGPRILGEATGLSAFWVMFSILIFGGLFGFTGMVVGVPTFTLIYSFVSEIAQNRLARRALPSDTAAYQQLDHIEQIGGEKIPVYSKPAPPPEKKPRRSFRTPKAKG